MQISNEQSLDGCTFYVQYACTWQPDQEFDVASSVGNQAVTMNILRMRDLTPRVRSRVKAKASLKCSAAGTRQAVELVACAQSRPRAMLGHARPEPFMAEISASPDSLPRSSLHQQTSPGSVVSLVRPILGT